MSRRHALAAVSAAVVGLVIGGLLLAVVAATGVPLFAALLRRRSASRQLRAIRRALPSGLDLLVLGAEAGLTPHQMISLLHRSGPIALRPAFGDVVRRTERGELLADALDSLPRHLGAGAVAATDALRLAQRHGAPLADALAVITSEAQRQRRAHTEAAARRLPVLLSFPLVCCILPAFVLLAIAPAVLSALTSLRSTGW